MRLRATMLALLALGIASPAALAQIYECVGEDGGRVFSDEKCGPDAKVVRGVTSKKRSTPAGSSAPRPKPMQRAAPELEALSQKCDAGDMKACKEWTLGGGPNLLRQKERALELECEGGVLSACEERYCKEGLNADCRARVLRTAKLAGEDWYLREESRDGPNGSTRYQIRCVPENAPSRDVAITCASLAGPNRCTAPGGKGPFPRLDRAASTLCAKRDKN